MLSRFINSFKRNDLDEQRAFQTKVLSMLRELLPERSFSASDDPLTLQSGESTLGLTNLRANFLLTTQTDADLRELLNETLIISIDAATANEEEISWSSARSVLMPQLMPAEFLLKLDLVSQYFGDNIVIGYVLDAEKTYSYVTERMLARWDIDLYELSEKALENLEVRSKGLEATVIEGTNGIIAVDTMDGFDATRILLPDLRKRFAEILGTRDFFFGVPNRDFLICWSANDDEQFQSQMRGQITSDSESRPYPLSGRTFLAKEDGTISCSNQSESNDPQAAAAELN